MPFVFCGELAKTALPDDFIQDCLGVNLGFVLLPEKQQKKSTKKSSKKSEIRHYLGVANNEPTKRGAKRKMIDGFNRVIGARLADMEFYVAQDQRQSQQAFIDKLADIDYHPKLGNQAARLERVIAIARAIRNHVRLFDADDEKGRSIDEKELSQVESLARAQFAALPTLLMAEYPALQPSIAREYFLKENPDVETPATLDYYRRCVALEKLVGMFAVGETPTGSKDPHGLRAAAWQAVSWVLPRVNETQFSGTGVVAGGFDIQLRPAVQAASDVFYSGSPIETEGVAGYCLNRLSEATVMLSDAMLSDGETKKIFEAVCVAKVQAGSMGNMIERITQLSRLYAGGERWRLTSLGEVVKRINNILRKSNAATLALPVVAPALFNTEEERDLYHFSSEIQPPDEPSFINLGHLYDVGEKSTWIGMYYERIMPLAKLLAAFFDNVRVNVDDDAIRLNRLALLKQLQDRLNHYADLSVLFDLTAE